MVEFFQTGMGRKFYEADVPALIRVLGRIATALEQKTVVVESDEDAKKKQAWDVATATVKRNLAEAEDAARFEAAHHAAQHSMRQSIVAELQRRNWPEAADIAQRVATTSENKQAIFGLTGSKS